MFRRRGTPPCSSLSSATHLAVSQHQERSGRCHYDDVLPVLNFYFHFRITSVAPFKIASRAIWSTMGDKQPLFKDKDAFKRMNFLYQVRYASTWLRTVRRKLITVQCGINLLFSTFFSSVLHIFVQRSEHSFFTDNISWELTRKCWKKSVSHFEWQL